MNDKISTRMVAACLLITTFLGCGGAEPNWQSGDSKDKAVTASFPRKPKPGKGEDDRDLTVATFRDTSYFIGSGNFPTPLPGVAEVLESCQDELQTYWATIIRTTEISLGECQGIEIVASNLAGTEFIVTRLYAQQAPFNNVYRVYEIAVQGNDESLIEHEYTSTFFDSFVIKEGKK